VSLAIKSIGKKNEALQRKNFRMGMVLVSSDTQPSAVQEFEAEVVILNNASTIRCGYQAVIHCGVIRQTAHIVEMDKEYLRL